MDLGEAFAGGSYWGTSAGYVDEFALIPASINTATNSPYTTPGPVILTDICLTQQPGGTGICVVFFDTLVAPVNGRAMFVGGAGPDPVRIVPISSGGLYSESLSAPWLKFAHGCVAVVSTSYTTVTRAGAQAFFSYRYAATMFGGSGGRPGL